MISRMLTGNKALLYCSDDRLSTERTALVSRAKSGIECFDPVSNALGVEKVSTCHLGPGLVTFRLTGTDGTVCFTLFFQ